MAHLNRFIVDVVTDEPLSERRMEMLAAEISEWVHVLGVESDDSPINVEDKYASGHEHDTTEERCGHCYYHARDSKNGDLLV